MTLAVDLYCGLGGWAEGLLAAGFDVVGFDIEQHEYGIHKYPAQLVLQDVLTIDGARFKDAALIVASPPCTEYSYMAMPWKRAKQIALALRGHGEFPDNYSGSRTIGELRALFDACFRIQAEASKAAGRRVPMVVENVRGAQEWVGKARWHYGSYYLWGDVPALMPVVGARGVKVGGLDWSKHDQPDYKTSGAAGCFRDSATKNAGGSWFRVAHNTASGKGQNPDGRKIAHTPHMTNPSEHDGVKQGGDWFGDASQGSLSQHSGKSLARKAASAMIAKIPFRLAHHIGAVYGGRQ